MDDVCYIANVGDSRALLSCDGGRYTVALSTDHKPNDEKEHKRIIEAGGKIYQTQTVAKIPGMASPVGSPIRSPQNQMAPQ